ncbi:YolD-like family protein [Halobacillus litoralis]|uniref:YolD-like family protein n=1 Tax=Halobacillus litoralis TaxID=45668 RepID=A0A410MDL5_9BACI|nr:YolD-like family protein [Halobacillus litoralis]QAS52783.1 YolD-like family protein [Halobacillus litoralis]
MDNRNRDRGTLKWTSLMLPEHVEMIKQVWKEDVRIEKPILDEQQWEEIGYSLQRALKNGLSVEIQYHNGFDISKIKVKVLKLDSQMKGVKCIGVKDKLHTLIKFEVIINVKIL